MGKHKTHVQKLLKKFQKNNWVIECPNKHLYEFLEILECEGIRWNDDSTIVPEYDASELKYFDDRLFEIIKKKKLNFKSSANFPYYHYEKFTFMEFFELMVEALNKDNPDLEITIFDAA